MQWLHILIMKYCIDWSNNLQSRSTTKIRRSESTIECVEDVWMCHDLMTCLRLKIDLAIFSHSMGQSDPSDFILKIPWHKWRISSISLSVGLCEIVLFDFLISSFRRRSKIMIYLWSNWTCKLCKWPTNENIATRTQVTFMWCAMISVFFSLPFVVCRSSIGQNDKLFIYLICIRNKCRNNSIFIQSFFRFHRSRHQSQFAGTKTC